ncbi:glycoside hydrolase family 1 protein, partial [Listeria monocytogenes]|nr:glycoside hydrolase family 1 protein [Listeria monocytogenes]
EDYLEVDGTVHDPYRIDYLSQHISQCLAAINAGVDLIGYSPWSAIDLISVHEGIRKRYGFIYVDRNDAQEKEQKRVRKDSFYWYQKLIEEGAIPSLEE